MNRFEDPHIVHLENLILSVIAEDRPFDATASSSWTVESPFEVTQRRKARDETVKLWLSRLVDLLGGGPRPFFATPLLRERWDDAYCISIAIGVLDGPELTLVFKMGLRRRPEDVDLIVSAIAAPGGDPVEYPSADRVSDEMSMTYPADDMPIVAFSRQALALDPPLRFASVARDGVWIEPDWLEKGSLGRVDRRRSSEHILLPRLVAVARVADETGVRLFMSHLRAGDEAIVRAMGFESPDPGFLVRDPRGGVVAQPDRGQEPVLLANTVSKRADEPKCVDHGAEPGSWTAPKPKKRKPKPKPDAAVAGDPVDVAEFERAAAAILHFSRPMGLAVMDHALANLGALLRAGGGTDKWSSQVARVVRVNMKKVWEWGVLIPLARQRNDLHAEVLRALPGVDAKAAVTAALPQVRKVRDRIEAGGPVRAHLDAAVAFLEAIEVTDRASAHVMSLAFNAQGPERFPAAWKKHMREEMGVQIRRTPRELHLQALQAVVEARRHGDDISRAVELFPTALERLQVACVQAGVVDRDDPEFAWAFGAFPAYRRVQGWNSDVRGRIVDDLLKLHAFPRIDALRKRHPDLRLLGYALETELGLEGTATVILGHQAFTLTLRYAFVVDRTNPSLVMTPYMQIAGREEEIRTTEAMEAVFANLGSDGDGPAARVRRLMLKEYPELKHHLDAFGDEIAVVNGTRGLLPPSVVLRLAALADAGGVVAHAETVVEGGASDTLIENGFVWGARRHEAVMTRQPSRP